MLPMQSTHNVACQCLRGRFSASVCVFVTVMIPWTSELAFNCLACRREVSCECVAMVLVALIEDDLQMFPRVSQLKAIKKSQSATINFHSTSLHRWMCLLVCLLQSPVHNTKSRITLQSCQPIKEPGLSTWSHALVCRQTDLHQGSQQRWHLLGCWGTRRYKGKATQKCLANTFFTAVCQTCTHIQYTNSNVWTYIRIYKHAVVMGVQITICQNYKRTGSYRHRIVNILT